MNANSDSLLIEVFAGSAWDAGIVQNLLESANIPTFLQDQYLGTLVPWQASTDATEPIKVVVAREDFELANQIVDQFYKNLEEN